MVAAVVMAVLAGCATPPAEVAREGDPEAACRAFFRSLDEQVAAAGVRDGIGAPPAAYPYLRATRFLGSFRGELDDPAVRGAWLDAAQALDREARLLELRHLGPDARDAVAVPAAVDSAAGAVVACGERLRRADGLDRADGPWPEAAEALRVPGEYVTWHRALGVYPLLRWFISAGVASWQQGVRETFANTVPADEPGLRYRPVMGSAEPGAAGDILARAPRDPLGRPELSQTEWRRVFEHFAPVVELEQDVRHNRLGWPLLRADGLPAVDTQQPVVFIHRSYMPYGDETLTQLNYNWWFSERPVDHWLDLLGGRLDGLTVRLTLDGDGRLLLVETMHNCGCYHQHYPVQGLEPRDEPRYAEKPLILPGPEWPGPGERLRVRLEGGTHYVQHLAFGPTPETGQPYVMDDYDTLRSLPAPDGGRRSLFQPDGLVAGTERSERWFLWVSGVPQPGAMRQYYNHATAFVGRRHFDDPDLMERIYTDTR